MTKIMASADILKTSYKFFRGRLIGCVRPFYEQAVSDLGRSMHLGSRLLTAMGNPYIMNEL
jgi:hypothetical protein